MMSTEVYPSWLAKIKRLFHVVPPSKYRELLTRVRQQCRAENGKWIAAMASTVQRALEDKVLAFLNNSAVEYWLPRVDGVAFAGGSPGPCAPLPHVHLHRHTHSCTQVVAVL